MIELNTQIKKGLLKYCSNMIMRQSGSLKVLFKLLNIINTHITSGFLKIYGLFVDFIPADLGLNYSIQSRNYRRAELNLQRK